MRPRLLLLLATTASSALAASGDLVSDLSGALVRLNERRSYAWETTIEPAVISVLRVTEPASPSTSSDASSAASPLTRSDLAPVPIVGLTDKTAGTLLTAAISATDEGLTMRSVHVGAQAVAETPDGWLDAGELDLLLTRDPRGHATVGVRNHRISKTAFYYTGRLQVALRPPAEELSRLLADANPPMQIGRTLVATLSAATAKQFLHELRFREGPHAAPASPVSAEGRITIWLKQDDIVRYEVVIEGDVRSHPDSATKGREHRVQLTKITTLDRFNQAKVALPPDALRAMAR